jgi:transcriptional regulator of acetoin/glycerol metabolism
MPKMHEKTKRALALIGTVREIRPIYWTISAAARECGVSTQTLHRHLRRRKSGVNLPQAPENQT